ncbi:hypothetical protein ACOME3_007132 [Neoechinorhynchus agilis]
MDSTTLEISGMSAAAAAASTAAPNPVQCPIDNEASPPPTYKDVVNKQQQQEERTAQSNEDDPQFTYKYDTNHVPEVPAGGDATGSTQHPPNPSNSRRNDQAFFPLRVFHISEYFYRNLYSGREDDIGSAWMFLLGFAVAFALNGLGLLIILCLASTLAVRCGAFSGFGLFIVKWALVIQSRPIDNQSMRVGLFLLLFGFGSFLFLHGLLVFILAKRHAALTQRLNVATATIP